VVLRLITGFNLVVCCSGRSAGLAPPGNLRCIERRDLTNGRDTIGGITHQTFGNREAAVLLFLSKRLSNLRRVEATREIVEIPVQLLQRETQCEEVLSRVPR
jgi:hypothetical protein